MKCLEEVFTSMDQKNDLDDQQEEEILLPGFRFHPTDEELVGFYLRRKVQQKPLCIELIKELDIYKIDPWDLPKMGSLGEKEWYFYCTRERKYPNSTRPNRVAVAGFWKATGIDKPIYSSNNGKTIIGLKKSLVFYKGRAAKAFKTDWMMHEFRLPTANNNNVRSNENVWTICRVFKKSAVVRKNLQHGRPTCIPSGNCIGIDFIREELPSNEAVSQTSFSSNLCNTDSLTDDQCCSTESSPPEMTGLGKINENSGDDDMHLTETSASFQSLEMSHNYFHRDQMSHFNVNLMQEQAPPHIADSTGYRPLCVYDKIHQLNFSYENHQQKCVSGRYADSAYADFQENICNRLSQGSASQNYSFALDYMMS